MVLVVLVPLVTVGMQVKAVTLDVAVVSASSVAVEGLAPVVVNHGHLLGVCEQRQFSAARLPHPKLASEARQSLSARPSACMRSATGISSSSVAARRGPSHNRGPAPHLEGSLPRS